MTSIKENAEDSNDLVSKHALKWDPLFTKDVIELREHLRSGHLGQWLYSDPQSKDDVVNGAQLWSEFIQSHNQYYIPPAEYHLARQGAQILYDLVPEPVALGFLGIGSNEAFRRKDLEITRLFNKITNMQTYDISEHYLRSSMSTMNEVRPKPPKGAILKDLFSGFDLPLNGANKARRIITMFGGTLVNVEAFKDANFEFILPEQAIRKHLQDIRKSLNSKDIFVVTHDSNRDEEKLIKAYSGLEALFCNFAHRIKRDTPYKNIDTSETQFEVSFDEASSTLNLILYLNFGDNTGTNPYLINTSPKIDKDLFLKWCKKEKFTPKETLSEDGVHMHILEAS